MGAGSRTNANVTPSITTMDFMELVINWLPQRLSTLLTASLTSSLAGAMPVSRSTIAAAASLATPCTFAMAADRVAAMVFSASATQARSPVLRGDSAMRLPTEIPDFNQHPRRKAAKRRVALCRPRRRQHTIEARAQLAPGIGRVARAEGECKAVGDGVGLGVAGRVETTVLARFDGEFASHSSTYAGTDTFRYRW